MLSGFNTNFRYRGVMFHVQTEDSGRGNPHVITHLFHGGNIMASEKRDYSDLLAESAGGGVEGAVRKLMEGQHKSMLKRLSRGEHDAAIEERMGPDVFRAESASESTDPPSVTEEESPSAGQPLVAEALVGWPTGSDVSALLGDLGPQADAEPTRVEMHVPEAEQTQPVSRLSRVFGNRVVSEKPLDEVVLDYLVENARKRKRTTK